ncbi:MAG: hypothetical protein JWO48_2250, partial [Bryobacterales bacterium]|nr:hypothetical protein [Bryobacterales bacterium]
PGGSDMSSTMKTITVLAVVLIAVGLLALAYQGFTYTTREKVVDIGPVHVTAEKTKTLPLPPILGVIAVVSGVGLLVFGRKKV